jgi:hypothetical protein
LNSSSLALTELSERDIGVEARRGEGDVPDRPALAGRNPGVVAARYFPEWLRA